MTCDWFSLLVGKKKIDFDHTPPLWLAPWRGTSTGGQLPSWTAQVFLLPREISRIGTAQARCSSQLAESWAAELRVVRTVAAVMADFFVLYAKGDDECCWGDAYTCFMSSNFCVCHTLTARNPQLKISEWFECFALNLKKISSFADCKVMMELYV